jgi:hypothetical protein
LASGGRNLPEATDRALRAASETFDIVVADLPHSRLTSRPERLLLAQHFDWLVIGMPASDAGVAEAEATLGRVRDGEPEAAIPGIVGLLIDVEASKNIEVSAAEDRLGVPLFGPIGDGRDRRLREGDPNEPVDDVVFHLFAHVMASTAARDRLIAPAGVVSGTSKP